MTFNSLGLREQGKILLWEGRRTFYWENYSFLLQSGAVCPTRLSLHVAELETRTPKIPEPGRPREHTNLWVQSVARERRPLGLCQEFGAALSTLCPFLPSFCFWLTSPLLEITQFIELPQYVLLDVTL